MKFLRSDYSLPRGFNIRISKAIDYVELYQLNMDEITIHNGENVVIWVTTTLNSHITVLFKLTQSAITLNNDEAV